MYADDAKQYSTVNSENDCKLIQEDIDSLYDWSVKWVYNLIVRIGSDGGIISS